MGSIFSSVDPTVEEQNYYNEVSRVCNKNKNDDKFLIGLFKKEWNMLCTKRNEGSLNFAHQFTPCTTIISFIKDPNLFVTYQQFIDKWNKKSLRASDFDIITIYLQKFH